MSTTAVRPPSGEPESKPEGVRTYRGRSLTELIPQIRAELGDDAIILREREGLIGGVSGFFAKRCVEVDARRAARIDVYDDDDDADEFEELLPAEPLPPRRAPARVPTPAPVPADARSKIETLLEEDQSFADQLLAAQDEPEADVAERTIDDEPAQTSVGPLAEPAPAPVSDLLPAVRMETAPAPAPAAAPVPAAAPAPTSPARTRRRSKALTRPGDRSKRSQPVTPGGLAGIARGLIGQGIGEGVAARLVTEAAAHGGAFAIRGDFREAVRRTLANNLPRPMTLPADGAAVAVVGAGGAGKTRTTAALASAYKRASTLSVSAISLAAVDRGRGLKELLGPARVEVKSASKASKSGLQSKRGRAGSMTIIDTPAVAPGDQAAVRALASELGSLALDAVYVAIPATLGAEAARQLLEGMLPLSPSGIVITHADETDQIGVAVELASTRGLPIAYVHEGLELGAAISSPDPTDIAKRLLP